MLTLFYLVLCHLLKGFFNSVKDPFRSFHIFSKGVFIFFPIFILQGGEASLYHRFVAIRVMAAFQLLQGFSGWRFLLPLTLYSCLLFFVSQLSNPSLLCFFLGERIPTFLARTVLFPAFSTSFRDTPPAFLRQPAVETVFTLLLSWIPTFLARTVLFPAFSTSFRDTPPFRPPVSTAQLTAFFSPFCLQVFVETLLTQVGRLCFISFIDQHRSQLPVAEGLLAALIVTTKQRLLWNAHRTRYETYFLHLPPDPHQLPLSRSPVFLRIPPELFSFLAS